MRFARRPAPPWRLTSGPCTLRCKGWRRRRSSCGSSARPSRTGNGRCRPSGSAGGMRYAHWCRAGVGYRALRVAACPVSSAFVPRPTTHTPRLTSLARQPLPHNPHPRAPTNAEPYIPKATCTAVSLPCARSLAPTGRRFRALKATCSVVSLPCMFYVATCMHLSALMFICQSKTKADDV